MFYSEDEFFNYIDCLIQEAIDFVLNMINEHEKLNLKELKKLKESDLKTNKYILLCHKCICYDYPGIVNLFCYGLKDNNNNYYYMLTTKYLKRNKELIKYG